MERGYRIVNWSRFQHYTKRNPPWIKLHYEILSSADWVALSDTSRVLAIACMLIASRNEGFIPSNKEYIKRVAYLNKTPDFGPLLKCGFIKPCGDVQADASMMQADATSESDSDSDSDSDSYRGVSDTKKAQEVLAYWNSEYDRKIETISKIKDRIKQGATVEDCKRVINFKTKEWMGTRLEKFLQPATLFAPTKFEDYLSQANEGPAQAKPKVVDHFEPDPEITEEDREKSLEYLQNLNGVGKWE